jgi:dynein intermediate chain 2
MTDYHTYQKKRKEFGRPPLFEDTETKIVGTVKAQPNVKDNFISRDPNSVILDNNPTLSEHTVRIL